MMHSSHIIKKNKRQTKLWIPERTSKYMCDISFCGGLKNIKGYMISHPKIRFKSRWQVIQLLSVLLRKRFLKLPSHPTSQVSRSEGSKSSKGGVEGMHPASSERRDWKVTERRGPEAPWGILPSLLPSPFLLRTNAYSRPSLPPIHSRAQLSLLSRHITPSMFLLLCLLQNISPGHTGTSPSLGLVSRPLILDLPL